MMTVREISDKKLLKVRQMGVACRVIESLARNKQVIKPQYSADGRLAFWFIVPTVNLRTLLHKRLKKQYPQLDYVVTWKDVHGHGLHIATK